LEGRKKGEAEIESMDDIVKLVGILDKAIVMERNAVKFYRRAADYVPSEAGKKILLWLSDFEKGHVKRLEDRRTRLIEESGIPASKFPPTQFETELSETTGSQEIGPEMSEGDIIMVAVANEERGYDYYQRKLSHIPEGPGRDLFETLMKEEKRHINILIDQRKHLEVNRIWGNFDEIVKGFK